MLKVLAISSPHFASQGAIKKSYSFNSKTPFSLQNALRDAVHKSVTKDGEWGESNFSDEVAREKSVVFMEFWEEERSLLLERLETLRPNLLLIGTMTLGFPGAVEVAKLAREVLGNQVCIMLGGKHINESFFSYRGEIVNLRSSPVTLMEEEAIPKLFDIVVSGDGEKLISRIGEVISMLLKRSLTHTELLRYKTYIEEAEGDWIAGVVTSNQNIVYLESRKNNPIDYNRLAFPSDQFKLTKGFEVFKTDLTAHAYSDMSKGCAYNCFFCSEKSYINGPFRRKDQSPANRLFNQFQLIQKVARTRYEGKSVSIFVEDSIFLGGIGDNMDSFYQLLKKSDLKLPFGVQFTLDTFLFETNLQIIGQLRDVGLEYVAFGVETGNEEIAKTFSKNSNKGKSWLEKTEEIVRQCKKLDLSCGMFLLWGLGETQEERMNQLRQITFWKFSYEVNIEVGLNIATTHPLRNQDTPFSYLDWGTAHDSPYLPYFIELFGEASEKYRFTEKNFPSIEELETLRELYFVLKKPLSQHV